MPDVWLGWLLDRIPTVTLFASYYVRGQTMSDTLASSIQLNWRAMTEVNDAIHSTAVSRRKCRLSPALRLSGEGLDSAGLDAGAIDRSNCDRNPNQSAAGSPGRSATPTRYRGDKLLTPVDLYEEFANQEISQKEEEAVAQEAETTSPG